MAKFKVQIKSSPVEKEENARVFEYEISKNVEDLTFDEVEFIALDYMDDVYPEKYYPAVKLGQIYVFNEDDKKWYPVCVEDSEMPKDYEKVLVLPYARYDLTEECRLWYALKEQNIIDQDEEFNYDSMHSILTSLKK